MEYRSTRNSYHLPTLPMVGAEVTVSIVVLDEDGTVVAGSVHFRKILSIQASCSGVNNGIVTCASMWWWWVIG